jgi:putative MATE family efflux protein
MDAKTKILLEGPIGRTLLWLALPNIAVMAAQAFVGLIETYFIAELGTDALAGIAIVFPVFMLFQMISAGAMGGGILSAVARALGAGRKDEADLLAWHAVALAIGLGLLTTLVMLPAGPSLYGLMGGRDASLAAAIVYANLVFGGAILLWLFNSLAAVIRGTGNMFLPALVVLGGVVILVPLSPLLIFGMGPMPRLGITGGAVAVLIYYAVGSAIFAAYIWSGRGVLHPSRKIPALSIAKLGDILRVGAPASIVATTTNVTIATATAFVGAYGPEAVAGYGTGARLEYLLVPLVFGLGAPLGAMVGTAVGAGQFKRAAKAAWIGAIISGILTEAIGVAAAVKPQAWLDLYGNDPTMMDFGIRYLQTVGPFYGFFGFGLALYFAAQGTGRLLWPLAAGIARLVVAAGGGFLATRLALGTTGVYAALAAGMMLFWGINSFAVFSGAWLRHVPVRKAETPVILAVAE